MRTGLPHAEHIRTRMRSSRSGSLSVAIGRYRCHISSNYHTYRPRVRRLSAYRNAVSTHIGHFIAVRERLPPSYASTLTGVPIFTQYVDTYAHRAIVEGHVVRLQAFARGPEGSPSAASVARFPLASQAQPTSRPCPGRQGRRFGLGRLGREEIVERRLVGRPVGGRLCDVCVSRCLLFPPAIL